jgi:hypothetical protein
VIGGAKPHPGKTCMRQRRMASVAVSSRVERRCQQFTRRLVESDEPHLFDCRWR